MSDRVSPAQRIKLRNRAEVEIHRYKDDHALWHKHVHNVDMDPAQIFKCIEMDDHHNTIDFSCRRTGKTVAKELYLLKHNATNPDQELGIVAPRIAQSIVNLEYHLEAIQRSSILSAYIAHKRGRSQVSDTKYEFANRSKARAYGIMSQVDGGDLTCASLEEVDDLPSERLFSNFLLMLGSKRRLGAATDSVNKPQIRITGVFKGADTLTRLIKSGHYHQLLPIDVYTAIEMGIVNEKFMMEMRDELSPDEYLRQLLCLDVSATNLIYERYVRRAMQIGLKAGIEIADPVPGVKYRKRGLISFGYDHTGHGENPQASRSALVVTEQIGNYVTFPYARTWHAGADDQVVMRDLIGLWEYFAPDYAIGDAYGVGMLTNLNDQLFARGLTTVDRRTIGDGDSTPTTWPEWPFAPLQFQGMTKHNMAQTLRLQFHNNQAAIPYFDDFDVSDDLTGPIRLLMRQLINVKPEATTKPYASYKMADTKIGDDLFDAAMASVWALVTRGLADGPTVILRRSKTREQLLQRPAIALPAA